MANAQLTFIDCSIIPSINVSPYCSLQRTSNEAHKIITPSDLNFMCRFSELTSLELGFGKLLLPGYEPSALQHVSLDRIQISAAWVQNMPNLLSQLTELKFIHCTVTGTIDEALLSSISTLR